MEHFALLSFKKKQLASLNRCRMYLQIVMAADTTNSSGNQIYKEIYLGKKNSFR